MLIVLRRARRAAAAFSSSVRRLGDSSSSATSSSRRIATFAPRPPLSSGLFSTPWALAQSRGAKMLGSDVRVGNMVQRKGRIYEVIKAQHNHQGRGGATIQAELRDVDTGNKIVERFRTDEAIERVFVEEKSFKFLFEEGATVTLMEPDTFEQHEVPKELFGRTAAYLKEDMTVALRYYDGRIMSASVPPKVICTVVQAQPNEKGLTATPRYKRVLLDNGLTVLAPPFVEAGEEIVVSTIDDSYVTRSKDKE